MLDTQKKAKLLWHCRRGMLELDLIFLRFMEKHYDTLSSKQLNDFESLLTCTDPELYSWLMGYESPEDKELLEIVQFIKMQDKF